MPSDIDVANLIHEFETGAPASDERGSADLGGIGDESAMQALLEYFSGDMAILNGDPARQISKLRVGEVRGDYTATVVLPDGGRTALLSSDYPVFGTSIGIPDLSLERSSDALVPTNPIVETRIADDIAGGVEFPNVDVKPLNTQTNSAVRKVGAMNAIYPNAFEDADLVVSPVDKGAEFFVQVRGEDSPTSFEFDLETELEISQGAQGAILIGPPERPSATISPASSHDASGKEVPTRTTLTPDGRMVITVDHLGDFDYPVLVDPVYEYWDSWYANQGLSGLGKWQWSTNAPLNDYAPRIDCAPGLTCWGQGKGLYMYSRPNMTYAANSYGQFVYTAPGGPKSYIGSAVFRMYMKRNGCNGSNAPYGYVGLYSPSLGSWQGYQNFSADLNAITKVASGGLSSSRMAIVGISAGGSAVNLVCWREIAAGGATLTLQDSDQPTLESISSPTGWLSGGNANLGAIVKDQGLGARTFWVIYPDADGVLQVQRQDHSCSGGSEDQCPLSWDRNGANRFAIPVTGIKNGESSVSLMATDAGGTSGGLTQVPIKVDRQDPVITLGGSAFQNRDTVVSSVPLSLRAIATDGDSTTASSGVTRLAVEVDGVEKQVLFSAACSAGSNCTADRSWTLDPSGMANGTHAIAMVATDAVGRTSRKQIQVIVDHQSACPDRQMGPACTNVTSGPVYKTQLADGDGEYVATEWVQLGSRLARREENSLVQTRSSGPCPDGIGQCDQVRAVLSYPATETPNPAYSVEYSRNYPAKLSPVADALALDGIEPVIPAQVVNVAQVLRPGQVPPPGNSQNVLRYDNANGAEDGAVNRTWVDANTMLPLKVSTFIEGVLEYEEYFSYQATTIAPGTLPGDHFLLAQPSNASSNTQVNLDIVDDEPGVNPAATFGERLEAATKFRETFGLESEQTYVEATLIDPSMQPARDTWGVPLDASELTYMDNVSELGRIAGDLESWANEPGNDQNIGGVWLTYENGQPKIHVAVVDPENGDVRDAIDSAQGEVDDLPSAFELVETEADSSYEDLVEVYEDIESDPAIQDADDWNASVDPEIGKVVVGIAEPGIDDLSDIEARYDPLVEAVELSGDEVVTERKNVCKSRGKNEYYPGFRYGSWRAGTCSPPAFAGLGIHAKIPNTQLRRRCSIGISVSRKVAGHPRNYGFLTSGHCEVNKATPWLQGKKQLGRWGFGKVTETLDFGYVVTNRKYTTPRVMMSRAKVPKMKWVANPTSYPKNREVCLMGSNIEEVKCGVIADKFVKGTIEGRPFKEQGRIDLVTARGDSGGPLVGDDGKTFVGLIRGGDEKTLSIFTWGKMVFDAGYGLQPILGD